MEKIWQGKEKDIFKNNNKTDKRERWLLNALGEKLTKGCTGFIYAKCGYIML